VVFYRQFCFSESPFKVCAIELIPNHNLAVAHKAGFLEDVEVKPTVQILVHGLPFYACKKAHILDRHDCYLWFFLPVGCLFPL